MTNKSSSPLNDGGLFVGPGLEAARAYKIMVESGLGDIYSHEGFMARVRGGTVDDCPYSILDNIICNRRWFEGYRRANKALALAEARP